MSAFPRLPYPSDKIPEGIAFIVPFANDDHTTEFYNAEYDLIGIYDAAKNEILTGKAIENAKRYFDKKACLKND